jgi:hypothetical protein
MSSHATHPNYEMEGHAEGTNIILPASLPSPCRRKTSWCLKKEKKKRKRSGSSTADIGVTAQRHVISQYALTKDQSNSLFSVLKLVVMIDNLQKQLDYLIHNLKAYNDFQTQGQSIRNTVKLHLYKWAKSQENMETVIVPQLKGDLYQESRARTQKQLLQDISTQN